MTMAVLKMRSDDSDAAASVAATLAMPTAVLFDLDGTLIDSVPDITRAVAELLRSEHLPALEEPQVRRMVEHGVRALVRRVYLAQGVALDEESLDQRTDSMLQVYPRYLTGRTTLMPGVIDALEFLSGQGCRLAVVTNKPEEAAKTVLEHFGLAQRFELIIADVAGRDLPRKPDPALLHLALAGLGLSAADVIMIGDSGIDVEAAKAGGMRCVAVRGGYTTEALERFGPHAVIDNLAALRDVFAR